MVRAAGERRARQFIEQRLARLCKPPGEDERRSVRPSLQKPGVGAEQRADVLARLDCAHEKDVKHVEHVAGRQPGVIRDQVSTEARHWGRS